MSTAPIVTIFVRHSEDCKYAGDEFCRRCKCRKHLRWSHNGKQHRRMAGTRSWTEAEEVKRQLQDQLAGRPVEARAQDNVRAVSEAVNLFIKDKKVQGISAGVIGKYTLELERLSQFCERKSVYIVQGITRELLTDYCATWETYYPSSTTQSKVRERLHSFLRYCYDCQWLPRMLRTAAIKVNEIPTMPLVGDEYRRLLDALYAVNARRWDGKKSSRGLSDMMLPRIHALLQLMRWSGLAIRDALSLPKKSLAWSDARRTYRVTTARQKTGTHVSVLLPPDVAAELRPLVEKHPAYVLFPETSLDFEDLAKTYTSRYIRPAFEAAKIPCDGHMVSHRLRDTFAVDLLQKGVPLEEVSKLLGHESIKTTERHYAKWIKARQDRLDSLVVGTWTSRKRITS